MTTTRPTRLRLVLYPDPVLRKVCAPVETFDSHIRDLARSMLAIMKEANGVGLAAPQLGLPLRLFVCNPTGEEGADMFVVNPELSDPSGASEQEEGCLSIPGVTVMMRRATAVRLRAFDADGCPFEREATDLLARIVQHEYDHLNGRLIIDNMSPAEEIANRRAIRQLRDEYAARKRR